VDKLFTLTNTARHQPAIDEWLAHVSVGFFTGAYLPDPQRLLQGSGKRMRHVKVKPCASVDANALAQLIARAYEDVKSRL
jgi:hypothetical protein